VCRSGRERACACEVSTPAPHGTECRNGRGEPKTREPVAVVWVRKRGCAAAAGGGGEVESEAGEAEEGEEVEEHAGGHAHGDEEASLFLWSSLCAPVACVCASGGGPSVRRASVPNGCDTVGSSRRNTERPTGGQPPRGKRRRGGTLEAGEAGEEGE
jgi:hypothetical protein